MSKQRSSFEYVLPPNDAATPAYEWVYQALRDEILAGRLRPGARLPSTRDLAAHYGVARGTIVNAFELLKSEGYVNGAVGSGTYVSDVLPDEYLRVRRRGVRRERLPAPRRFTPYGRVAQNYPNFQNYTLAAFRANVPAVDLFPTDLWANMTARAMRRASIPTLMGTDASGFPPLREAVSDYLNASRGVRCRPEQVIILSGVQEAIDLCARLFIQPGDRVCVEDPGYPGAEHIFRAAAAKIVGAPVDDEGMIVRGKAVESARFFYVTPAHQAPLGVTMSLRRRLALLELAHRSGALIFEDDYDSEYRFASRPVPALQGLDSAGCVIFAGSFNKVLFPSLRLGYLVAPPDLVPYFDAVRSQTTRHAQIFDQVVLHQFIVEGHFARHLRRMRQVYAERLATLLDAAKSHLHGLAEISPIEAGLQTMAWLAPEIDGIDAAAAAHARGLLTTPLRSFTSKPLRRDGLQLGFAAPNPKELVRGVRELAIALAPLAR